MTIRVPWPPTPWPRPLPPTPSPSPPPPPDPASLSSIRGRGVGSYPLPPTPWPTPYPLPGPTRYASAMHNPMHNPRRPCWGMVGPGTHRTPAAPAPSTRRVIASHWHVAPGSERPGASWGALAAVAFRYGPFSNCRGVLQTPPARPHAGCILMHGTCINHA